MAEGEWKLVDVEVIDNGWGKSPTGNTLTEHLPQGVMLCSTHSVRYRGLVD